MKQFFRFFAVLFMTVFASASSWAQTDPSSCAMELTVDAEVYIYNVGTGKYINFGEAWSSQTLVSDVPLLYKVTHPNGLDDGVYYLQSVNPVKDGKSHMGRTNSDGKIGSGNCGLFGDFNAGEAAQVIIEAVTGLPNTYTIRAAVDVPSGAATEGWFYGVNTAHANSNDTDGETWCVWYDCTLTDQGENCLWKFIDPTALNAIDLKNALDEAIALDLDVTAEQAVYDDRANKTAAEIADATKSLQNKIGMAKASAENPFNIANLFLADPSFNASNKTGWTSTFTVQNNMNFKGQANNDNEASLIGTVAKGGEYDHFPFMEFWNPGGDAAKTKAVGKAYFVADSLPAGIYKFSMMAYVNSLNENNITNPTQYVYFGDKIYPLTQSGMHTYGEFIELAEPMKNVEIGFAQTEYQSCNWFGIDEVQLTYYAKDNNAYIMAAKELLPEEFEEWFSDHDGYYTDQYSAAIYDAKDALDAAEGDESADKKAVYLQVKQAVEDFNANVALWHKLMDLEPTYLTAHRDLGEARQGDALEDPCTALLDQAEAWMDDPANSGATNEDLEQWFTDWDVKFAECKQNKLTEIVPGVFGNCNILLTNPGFKDDKGAYSTAGWTITGTAPNFFHDFPLVAEVWNANFDASQTITLPNDGAYTVSTHGFYRTEDTGLAWQYWQAAGQQETTNLSGENSNNTCRAYLYADNLTQRFANTFHNIYTRNEVEALAATYFTDEFMNKYLSDGNGGYKEISGHGQLNTDFLTSIEETYTDKNATYYRTNPHDFSFNQITTKEVVAADPDVPALIPNGVYSAYAVFNSEQYGDDYNMEINFLGRKNQVVKFGVKAENILSHGWTIFEPFKVTWWGKDVERLTQVMQKVMDNAEALAAEPMQKDSLAALNDGLSAAKTAISSNDGDALLAAYDAINAAFGPAQKSANTYAPLVGKKAELDTAIETYQATAQEVYLSEAQALQGEVAAAITGGTIADADVAAKIEEMSAVIRHLAISKDPGDFTNVINNPTYLVNGAASLAGWSFNETNAETKALAPGAELQTVGGVQMGIVEGWSNQEYNFNIWQDIDGLPNGYYVVTVQGIFRPFANDISIERMGLANGGGSLETVNALYSQIADSLTYIYANDESIIPQSPYILPTDERDLAWFADNNGGAGAWWQQRDANEATGVTELYLREIGVDQVRAYIPNNRQALAYRLGTRHFLPTDEEFASGEFFYVNKLKVQVTDGKLRIGIRNDNAAANGWSPHTNWHLYYQGTEGFNTDGINELSDNTAKNVKTTVFSIDGRQLNKAARGVNIVKTVDANGKETVRKVIVK